MRKAEALACAGGLASRRGSPRHATLREAHRRRYYRELSSAWDLWYELLGDSEHPREDPAAAGEAFRRILPHLSPHTAFLDFGCGDGCVLKRAARRCVRAHGADISAEALRRARLACRGLANVKLHRVTGAELTLPDASIDLVFCRRTLAHLDMEPAVACLQEIQRVLKSGGRFLFDLPDLHHEPHLAALLEPSSTSWPGTQRARLWTAEAATTLVRRCGFRVERVRPGAWFEVSAIKPRRRGCDR